MQLSVHHGLLVPVPHLGLVSGRAVSGVRNRPRSYRPRGMGQTQTSTIGTAASIASAGGAATAGILSSISALTAATVSIGAATAGIGAAVVGLIELGVVLAKVFSGCGETCTQATTYANQVEPQLLTNLQTYLAAPIHYASLQAAAVNNFNTAWNALSAACQSGSLAGTSAGTNCIGDRQNGACHYQTSPGGWQQNSDGSYTYVYPGAEGSGTTCWNWFVGYLDPIQNDPTVVPDPTTTDEIESSTAAGTTTSGTASLSTGGSTSTIVPLLIAAGLGFLLVMLI
jgi:hypothetical protein